MFNSSLRLRLTILLLLPLLMIAILAVFWRYFEAKATAERIYDQTLVALALAISRDVAESDGDIVSLSARDIIAQISADQTFFHIRGPDGVFVTGYAYPPISPHPLPTDEGIETFSAQYQDETVRAARLAETRTIEGITGLSVTTAWQPISDRTAFAVSAAIRAAILTAIMMTAVAAIIVFGIQFGLRPLRALEEAIEARSPDDINPIQRQIPVEAKGIVRRLNELFAQLRDAAAQRDRLIANAAHQLRNPIAALQGMAEAAESSSNFDEMHTRVREVVDSSKHVSRLTTQLLSLERLDQADMTISGKPHSLNETIRSVAEKIAPRVLERGISFSFEPAKGNPTLIHDDLLIGEAIENLVDNALVHGGAQLSAISIAVHSDARDVRLVVSNDGEMIPVKEQERIFERFAQGSQGHGSGLGLAIVDEIVRLHDGRVQLGSVNDGTAFMIIMPLAE